LLITAFDSGYFVIPPFKFIFNNDTANPLQTEPLLLEVHTVPTDTSATKLKDIKPPFDEPFNWKWYLPIAYWTLGIAAVLAAVIFVTYKMSRRKTESTTVVKPKIPAHITALAELERIRQESIWKEGKTKEYYSSISEAIRLYIENRFMINALELTTDEIVQAFKSQVVDALSKEKLQQVLVLSDFVKFAKQIPIEQEHSLTLQNAFDFVNGTKREDEPVQNASQELGKNTEARLEP
jgi:hypothetical protein